VLGTLVDMTWDFILAFPYSDTGSLNAMQTFMNDVSGRWSWQRQIYGHVFSASRGTLGTLQTLGTGRNDQHASIIGYNDSPSPSCSGPPAFAGACAVSPARGSGPAAPYRAADRDPGAPSQSRFQLQGPLDPQLRRRLDLHRAAGRHGPPRDGHHDLPDEFVRPGRYELPEGRDDVPPDGGASLHARRPSRRSWRGRSSPTTTPASAPDRTSSAPKIIRAYLIQLYGEMVNLGWVQDSAGFAANIIVARNAQNPNRVDVLWPGVLINQLDVFALLAQFRLSSASFAAQLAA